MASIFIFEHNSIIAAYYYDSIRVVLVYYILVVLVGAWDRRR